MTGNQFRGRIVMQRTFKLSVAVNSVCHQPALMRRESHVGQQHSDILLLRLDQSFFEDLAAAVRAFSGLFENVIRHARISAGNTIEKMIKMKLGAHGIAAFAALNQSLGLVYRRTLDKYHNLFLGRWIKKVAHRAGSLAPGHNVCTRIHFNGPRATAAGVNEG